MTTLLLERRYKLSQNLKANKRLLLLAMHQAVVLTNIHRTVPVPRCRSFPSALRPTRSFARNNKSRSLDNRNTIDYTFTVEIAHPLPAETMEGLLGIVPALEKARLYRGRGGELMRQAACKVVECLALTRAEVPVKTQVDDRFWFSPPF